MKFWSIGLLGILPVVEAQTLAEKKVFHVLIFKIFFNFQFDLTHKKNQNYFLVQSPKII